MQATSLSYHAATGNVALAVNIHGEVRILQAARSIGPPTAPLAILPNHACVRERLAEAEAQEKAIKASLDEQLSREKDLKRSIADLEAKRARELMLFPSY